MYRLNILQCKKYSLGINFLQKPYFVILVKINKYCKRQRKDIYYLYSFKNMLHNKIELKMLRNISNLLPKPHDTSCSVFYVRIYSYENYILCSRVCQMEEKNKNS